MQPGCTDIVLYDAAVEQGCSARRLAGRATMPQGVTAEMVERSICDTMNITDVQDAIRTKKALFKTKKSGRERQTDKDALYKHHRFLQALLQFIYSPVFLFLTHPIQSQQRPARNTCHFCYSS